MLKLSYRLTALSTKNHEKFSKIDKGKIVEYFPIISYNKDRIT